MAKKPKHPKPKFTVKGPKRLNPDAIDALAHLLREDVRRFPDQPPKKKSRNLATVR